MWSNLPESCGVDCHPAGPVYGIECTALKHSTGYDQLLPVEQCFQQHKPECSPANPLQLKTRDVS
jgi:hypothetical protein